MSRRSRRRNSNQNSYIRTDSRGEPFLRSNDRESLPPADESLIQYWTGGGSHFDDFHLSPSMDTDQNRVRFDPGRAPGLPVRSSQPVRVFYPSTGRKIATNRDSPLKLLRFTSPARVVLCVKRGIRREVLFAQKVAGFKGRSPGPYRRTQNSQYGC